MVLVYNRTGFIPDICTMDDEQEVWLRVGVTKRTKVYTEWNYYITLHKFYVLDPIALHLVGLFYNYLSSPYFTKFEKNFEDLYLKNYR